MCDAWCVNFNFFSRRYLKVELGNSKHGEWYSRIFISLRERLLSVPHHSGGSGKGDQSLPFNTSKVSKQPPPLSVWDILVAQDIFISGIMAVQKSSRDSWGKKDAKECKLKESLAEGGFRSVAICVGRRFGETIEEGDFLKTELEQGRGDMNVSSVPLPSAPSVIVDGINPETAKMFKSNVYPALIEFSIIGNRRRGGALSGDDSNNNNRIGNDNNENSLKIKKGTKDENFLTDSFIPSPLISPSLSYKVIVKTGDDLRQDQLVSMMIRLMDNILKNGMLDLCLRPYSIIAMSSSSGLVEFVEGSIPLSQILASNSNSIMKYFHSVSPVRNTVRNGDSSAVKTPSTSSITSSDIQPSVIQRFVRSCAGYCVITYLLGVGDRHLDNIMLLPNGQFFHIDFGFIFGRDPKPLPPAFRLTKEVSNVAHFILFPPPFD